MNKYKKGLVGEIKEEIKFEKEQEDLKGKYNLDVPKDVVIVEKSNVYKFTVKMLVMFVKSMATICLLVLASVGIITLIYPESRVAYTNVMSEILQQLSVYIPFLK